MYYKNRIAEFDVGTRLKLFDVPIYYNYAYFQYNIVTVLQHNNIIMQYDIYS